MMLSCRLKIDRKKNVEWKGSVHFELQPALVCVMFSG